MIETIAGFVMLIGMFLVGFMACLLLGMLCLTGWGKQ